MAHSLGYPTDIDRRPDRKERSREKQKGSITWQLRQRSECAYVIMARISSMYARPMWEDGCWLRTDQATVSHDLAFHSKILQNSNKFRINSNKLGKIGINWSRQWAKQAGCDLTVGGREQSDLTYNSANYQWRKGAKQPNLQQCKLPVKEGSRATWRTILLTVTQTVVRREQSDLMDNTICSCTDCCWKGAKWPDGQHYL